MKTNLNEVTQFQTNQTDFPVKFFTIKPGELAIVRFLVDSLDDLPVYEYHNIDIGEGKTRKVDCIRSLREDINKCPLCASNVPREQMIFIHMLQYYPDGRVEGKIWGRRPPIGNRGTGIIDQLKKALNTYGPLSEYVSSITRSGNGLDTTYAINVNLPEKIYPPTSFPVDKSMFENYTEEGTIIKEWTVDNMNYYLTTGQLPNFNTNLDFNSPNSVGNNIYSSTTAPQPFTDSASNNSLIDNVQPKFNNSSLSNDPEGIPFEEADNYMRTEFSQVDNFNSFASQQFTDRPIRRYN